MLFYLCKLPSTSVDIETVKELVMERYKYYSRRDFEYDISSEFDLIGYFIMCLIASNSRMLYPCIIKGERNIFVEKMKKLSVTELKHELSRAQRFVETVIQLSCSSISHLLKHKNLVIRILKAIRARAEHGFNENHMESCQKISMLIPFTFPLNMVATRRVEINKGRANIPCGLWKIFLPNIFECIMEYDIMVYTKLLQSIIYEQQDDRIRNIIESCKIFMTGAVSHIKKNITSKDIDQLSQYFPPCMANLHQILRKTHRLSYESRYQYTLFLKDIGLSVKENILFWKNEYTKPSIGATCIHNWEEKKSRYEYQISHLYGLVGARTLKTTHSCDKFIHYVTFRMDGGCPFVEMKKNDLIKSLPRNLCETDIEDILSLKGDNIPEKACAIYCKSQKNFLQCQKGMGYENENAEKILSPLHYYHLMRGINMKLV